MEYDSCFIIRREFHDVRYVLTGRLEDVGVFLQCPRVLKNRSENASDSL